MAESVGFTSDINASITLFIDTKALVLFTDFLSQRKIR